MLFDDLTLFESNIALITDTGEQLTYGELFQKVEFAQQKLGDGRKLVFIYVDNNINSIVAYIACVTANHPVLLLNPDSEPSTQSVTDAYTPNIIIHCTDNNLLIQHQNQNPIELHPELAILLSTSGSTGSPKLVKLSKENITSNTAAICKYLNLSDNDRAITTLKINYSYGLSIVNAHLDVGASVVLTNASTTDSDFWQHFSTHAVTSFSGVPYHFEMLHRQGRDLKQFPMLRYVTQAGGKLSPELVKQFAKQGALADFEFFVMYGQTEASPRISFLPPQWADEHPDCIGVAVPQGELQIIDSNGRQIVSKNQEGELRYRGPNVMMGYASEKGDLATKKDIAWLNTGDIATRNERNLFKIVGRKSRFVKIYGVRMSLDDLQNNLNAQGFATGVTNVDEKVIVAVESQQDLGDGPKVIRFLSEKFDLPATTIEVIIVTQLPKLANGKIDHSAIKSLFAHQHLPGKKGMATFGRLWLEEFLNLTGIERYQWSTLLELFAFHFPDDTININTTFNCLSGDSLRYVTFSLDLETYLGALPYEWHLKTITELEVLRN